MAPARVRLFSGDGNQTLAVVERTGEPSDNPTDYPVLTAAHLMGGEATAPVDTEVRREIDPLVSRDLRAQMVGGGLFKRFRDSGNLDILVLLANAGPRPFVQVLRETERPDSPVSGLTDAELERAWEVFALNVRRLAQAGLKVRKAKDWRG